MDATLVKDIGIKALLVGGAVLVSFWTFNAVKLVISARGINPLVRKFFDQIAAGRIDAAYGLTTKVIAMNDQILKEIVLLAAFIPLLIGTGGNVGAQSSTVGIRGLSTQKLKSLGAIKAVVKEAITGALLGVFMMLVVFPFAWWQGEGPLIASAVLISLIS